MNVLCVASEMAPFAKTGGLADVMAALPRQLARRGHDVRVFLPLYDTAKTAGVTLRPVVEGLEVRLGAHRYAMTIVGIEKDPIVHFVHCPALYARGGLYTSDADEHRRFLALSWAALQACQRMGFAPDVIHCNDWQSALIPLTLKARFSWDRVFARAKTLLTIHNLNYQGIFPAAIVPLLISRGQSLKLVEDCLAGDRILGFLSQKNPEEESPDPSALFPASTSAPSRIRKVVWFSSPNRSVTLTGGPPTSPRSVG